MDFESTRPHIRMTALENRQRINNEMRVLPGQDYELPEDCIYGSGITDESLLDIVSALKEQTDSLNRQVEELKRQADVQAGIETHLKEEAVTRSKDDRKYFWLGVLTSFVISMLVEHGSALMRFLQGLLPG